MKWLEFCYHYNIVLLEKALSQSVSRTRKNRGSFRLTRFATVSGLNDMFLGHGV